MPMQPSGYYRPDELPEEYQNPRQTLFSSNGHSSQQSHFPLRPKSRSGTRAQPQDEPLFPLHLRKSPRMGLAASSLIGPAVGLTLVSRLDDVVRLCCEISSHDQIKVTMRNSYKGAVVAGGAAFVGGLLGGPVGIAIGGAVGGLMGSWLTSGQFKPLPQILMKMSTAQKKKLYAEVILVLGSLFWTNATQLIALVMGNAMLQQKVTAALLSYVTNELRAKVC